MNANLNSTENFNELVFENRNKEYGAYVIRKSYNDNVTISLVVACAFFGMLSLLGILFTNNKIEIPDIVGTNKPIIIAGTEVVIIPEKKLVEKVIPKTDVAPRTDNGHVIVEDDKVKGLTKTNSELNINKNANPDGKIDSSASTKSIVIPIAVIPTPPGAIEKVVDQMPELVGMAKIISENLQYPRIAVENGTSGTVYVTFVVETDGSVSDVKVLQAIGDGCEQEAVRVVKLMPKWKPGINHGKPVRVQCNLPIKFRLK